MEKLILEVPSMYADHHVLAVRDALTGLKGVYEVYASSAWKQVIVSYDPKTIKPPAIEETLSKAGYPVGEGEPPVLVEADNIKRDPKWETLGLRVSQTNQVDVEMSGEHRRY